MLVFILTFVIALNDGSLQRASGSFPSAEACETARVQEIAKQSENPDVKAFGGKCVTIAIGSKG